MFDSRETGNRIEIEKEIQRERNIHVIEEATFTLRSTSFINSV